MHGWGISLFSWVHYRKLQQKEWFEKLHVKTCYRKSLPYKNRGKFEIRQHTARGTEKRQGTFRDQHRSCFLGKPALGAELSSWEGTHFSLEQGVMGQPLGEPCSGANRLTRRNVAWMQHSALPGKNGSHLLYFLFFSFKAAMSYSSCPGAVMYRIYYIYETIPTGCSCCCLRLSSSFPFTSHPAPLCRRLIQKGKTSVRVYDTYLYIYIGV